jgi:hypothetical protein
MLRSARNRHFLDISTAVLIALAISVFPITGGGGLRSGHFVTAAQPKSVQENHQKDIQSVES